MLQQKNILFRGYVTMTGLGPNSHFGIKYKYNSAESNINTLLVLDLNSNTNFQFI